MGQDTFPVPLEFLGTGQSRNSWAECGTARRVSAGMKCTLTATSILSAIRPARANIQAPSRVTSRLIRSRLVSTQLFKDMLLGL